MNVRWFHQLEESVIAFLLAAMTLITFAQVVARYVFNYSFTWALELSMFTFAGLIFLGLSFGVRVGAHIGVDALIKILPKEVARIAGIVACLFCLIYTAIAFYGSLTYVEMMYGVGILAQDIRIPQWVPRAALPAGFFLLFFRFSQVLLDMLRGRRTELLSDESEVALKYASDRIASGPEEE